MGRLMPRAFVIGLVAAVLAGPAGGEETRLANLAATARLSADRIVVHKGERRLELIREDKVVASYPVWLGRNPIGHKLEQGDGRTPEGRYYLDWRKDDSRFYRALHVSYPNLIDRIRATHNGVSPGGMIMIHGSPNNPLVGNYGLKRDWTEGCIAVTNRAMDEIWDAVPDGAPIDILP